LTTLQIPEEFCIILSCVHWAAFFD